MKKKSYFYVACLSRADNTKPEFKHYFRLYQNTETGAVLVDQGLYEKVSGWEKKYNAVMSYDNPYPLLD